MSILEQPLTSTTWRVDAVHSTVGFAVKHMIVSTFRGRFETYDATMIELDGDLAIHGWVDVSTIVVKDPDLAVHLQSPEFFDAAEHPQLRFSSADIDLAADGSVAVNGDLTIKGRTHPLRAAGSITPRSRTRSAASAAAWSSRPSSIAVSTAWSGTSRSRRAASRWTTR